MSDADAQLLLKKRARRRLVGAIAFVLFAAVVLPMVMDASPPLPTQEVQIRIPGQEQPIYTPPAALAKSAPTPAPAPAVAEAPAAASAAPATPPAAQAASAKPAPAAVAAVVAAPVVAAAVVAASDKAAAKTPESKAADKKPADKPADKPVVAEKHGDKPAEKASDKAKPESKKDDKKDDRKGDAKKGEGDRAAAILAGKPAAAAGAQVILIGAYANIGNVKVLRAKLDQIGVKTYTETLNSPQGTKTRLRAGPFANKDAAEKALDKMKRIGVSGVIAAK